MEHLFIALIVVVFIATIPPLAYKEFIPPKLVIHKYDPSKKTMIYSFGGHCNYISEAETNLGKFIAANTVSYSGWELEVKKPFENGFTFNLYKRGKFVKELKHIA